MPSHSDDPSDAPPSSPPARARSHRQRRAHERPAPRPIDAAGLQALALQYVARYATTAANLAAYLARKLKERPWTGDTPPDITAITARMVELGYIDDAAWAAMKGRAMSARGLGPRRVAQALHAAGVSPPTADPDATEASPLIAAVRLAEKKRLGPFARVPQNDPASQRRALAAMLRAGHSFDVARQVLAAPTPAAAHALLEDYP
jgi:regulatory protein